MKSDFENTVGSPGHETSVPLVPAARPVLTLNIALYEQHLAESGFTDEQKHDFLDVLWSIIVGFVDLGFGIDPVSAVLDGDDFQGDLKTSSSDDPALLSSGDQDETQPIKATTSLRADIESAVRKGRRT